MTNTMIILLEQIKLQEQGILNGTGQYVTIEDSNGKREVELPEEIHTFQMWKTLGYSVKKGEHAIAKFPIWKHTSKQVESESGETQEKENMFMKMSAFFKASQVEKIKAKDV